MKDKVTQERKILREKFEIKLSMLGMPIAQPTSLYDEVYDILQENDLLKLTFALKVGDGFEFDKEGLPHLIEIKRIKD